MALWYWGRDTGFQAGILDSFGHSGPCSSTGLLPASVTNCKGALTLRAGGAAPCLESTGEHFLALEPLLVQKSVPGTHQNPLEVPQCRGASAMTQQCSYNLAAVVAFNWRGKKTRKMCMELKQTEAAYAEYPTKPWAATAERPLVITIGWQNSYQASDSW